MKAPSPLLLDVFRNEGEFALTTHILPDGDAVGSCLALGLALTRRGKRADIVLEEPVPSRYRFLPGVASVRRFAPRQGRYVLVSLDSTEPSRCSCPAEAVAGAAIVVNIDHHVSNSYFGHHHLVDDSASATGEIVFSIIKGLGWGLTSDEATCLYTAVITDTGSFRFSNTTARSHAVCAELVAVGARPDRIAEEIYETRSLPATLLLARALSSLVLDETGEIAWMSLRMEDFRESGAGAEDTEGIVNNARMIEGVEVGLLFREIEGGRIRVTLRSREFVDVSRVAAWFAGGGHPRAAGCELPGPLEEAIMAVVPRVREAIAGGAHEGRR